MLSSYNLKNEQTIQISGLILQYCSATTLYRRLNDNVDLNIQIQTNQIRQNLVEIQRAEFSF